MPRYTPSWEELAIATSPKKKSGRRNRRAQQRNEGNIGMYDGDESIPLNLSQSNIVSSEEQNKLSLLLPMFNHVEPSVIMSVLRSQNGDVDSTIDKLLEIASEIESQEAVNTDSMNEEGEYEEFENELEGELNEEEPDESEDESEEEEEEEEPMNDSIIQEDQEELSEKDSDIAEFEDLGSSDINIALKPELQYTYLEDMDGEEVHEGMEDEEEDEEEEEEMEEEDEVEEGEEEMADELDQYEEDGQGEIQWESNLEEIDDQDATEEDDDENAEYNPDEANSATETASETEEYLKEDVESEDEYSRIDEAEGIYWNRTPAEEPATPVTQPEGIEKDVLLFDTRKWLMAQADEFESDMRKRKEEKRLLKQLKKQQKLLKKERRREERSREALMAMNQMQAYVARIQELEAVVLKTEEEKKKGMSWCLLQVSQYKKQLEEAQDLIQQKDEIINGFETQVIDQAKEIQRLQEESDLPDRPHIGIEDLIRNSKEALSDGAHLVQKNVMDGISKLEEDWTIIEKVKELMITIKDEMSGALDVPLRTAKNLYVGQSNDNIEKPQEEGENQDAISEEEMEQIRLAEKASLESWDMESKYRSMASSSVFEEVD